MGYFLTFDVGTTAMKCILFDTGFQEIFSTGKEYSIEAGEHGTAEIRAETYFDTFCRCVEEIREAGISTEDIATITFTTQGETLIPVDKEGKPLCKAIVWLDTRAGEEAGYIRAQIPDKELYPITGLWGIDGALPAAKILWLYKNRPDIYEKTHKFLLLEDYLIYRLTGRYVSEKSLQSSTGWYNIVDEVLYDRMTEICKIDGEKLPEILPCGTVVSTVEEKTAAEWGLSVKTVVTTGAMDQISSAVGAGNIKEGMCTETTGTALVVGATTCSPVFDVDRPVTIYKHYDGKFIYMPYCSTAGMTLKWFKDQVMPYAAEAAEARNISAYDVITEQAAASPAGSRGVTMLPQLSAQGAFLGLTLATGTEDLARSVLEGVAYMLRDILEQVEGCGIGVEELYSLGGGSYSPLWCRIKADVCRKPVVCTGYAQTTSLGAAVLASVAAGSYADVEEALQACRSTKRTVMPDEKNREAYEAGYRKYKKYLNMYNTQEV